MTRQLWIYKQRCEVTQAAVPQLLSMEVKSITAQEARQVRLRRATARTTSLQVALQSGFA
jgi:hypothetical protein